MPEYHMLLANWGEFENQFLDLYVYTLILWPFLNHIYFCNIIWGNANVNWETFYPYSLTIS